MQRLTAEFVLDRRNFAIFCVVSELNAQRHVLYQVSSRYAKFMHNCAKKCLRKRQERICIEENFF